MLLFPLVFKIEKGGQGSLCQGAQDSLMPGLDFICLAALCSVKMPQQENPEPLPWQRMTRLSHGMGGRSMEGRSPACAQMCDGGRSPTLGVAPGKAE